MDLKPTPAPAPPFDWAIYRSATLAGLAVLIPIPLVDWAFEEFFRRGMLQSIAKRRSRRLHPAVIKTFNTGGDWFSGCLLFPFRLLIEFLKRLSRKLFYFLTVKEASDKVALYWHQAYLIDHMIQQGHLDDPFSARAARQAMNWTLVHTNTSPLHRLAADFVQGSQHIVRTLLRARRGKEDKMLEEKKARLMRSWNDFAQDLKNLSNRYDQTYPQARHSLENQQAPPSPNHS